ncbi:hypothetical protein VCR31J2_1370080 [Vibrio coralliirubri]|uniref:Uncharacterized protein n=1 Tax=Vibrio coralliirubri TaxID=1516159 RepID=A0AA86X148_9VIBR|nr:hypothetical protein VCR31J2_1370080 [Vibrio coralliirubri]
MINIYALILNILLTTIKRKILSDLIFQELTSELWSPGYWYLHTIDELL